MHQKPISNVITDAKSVIVGKMARLLRTRNTRDRESTTKNREVIFIRERV